MQKYNLTMAGKVAVFVIVIGIAGGLLYSKGFFEKAKEYFSQISGSKSAETDTKLTEFEQVVTTKHEQYPAIIGSDAFAVIDSVKDFLSEDSNATADITGKIEEYKKGVEAYQKADYKTAESFLEKSITPKDPFGAVLLQNAKAVQSGSELIRIAFSCSLTGNSNELGLKHLMGIALAQEQINKLTGIGNKKLFIQMADDWNSPEQSKKVAFEICKLKDVIAVVGNFSSKNTIASATVFEKNKIVQVAPASSSPLISDAGDYIFRVCPSDVRQGAFLADFAFKDMRPETKSAIVYNPKDAYSNYLALSIESRIKSKKFESPAKFTFVEGNSDFQSIVDEIKSAKIENVFYTSEDLEGVYFIKELKTQMPTVRLFAGDSMNTFKILKDVPNEAEGVYISTFYHADADKPYQKEFTKAFLARYQGGKPNGVCALSFDAVMTIKKGIERSQQLTSDGLKDALYSISFEGATGKISFDNKGDVPNKPLVMTKIVKNAFTPIK